MSDKGFSLIEAVIGITVASIILVAFASLSADSVRLNRANAEKMTVELYLREVMEIGRDLEQSDWAEIFGASCTALSPCHAEVTGGAWEIYSGAESLESGIYSRWFIIEDVMRDGSTFPNNIDPAGSYNDPDTKKITAVLRWTDGSHPDETLEMYVYHYVP